MHHAIVYHAKDVVASRRLITPRDDLRGLPPWGSLFRGGRRQSAPGIVLTAGHHCVGRLYEPTTILVSCFDVRADWQQAGEGRVAVGLKVVYADKLRPDGVLVVWVSTLVVPVLRTILVRPAITLHWIWWVH